MPHAASQITVSPTVSELIREGIGAPPEIPEDVFAAALDTFLAERRLDMRGLAGELGIARATLYRRVGGRDHLLGEVIWFLARRSLMEAIEAGEGLRGAERVLVINERFMKLVHAAPGFHRLLDAEPEAALRILTSKDGPIQQRIIDMTERLLAQEEDSGALRLSIDRATLAYVIVRIGESFLYADVIAENEPDVEKAVEVISKLLR